MPWNKVKFGDRVKDRVWGHTHKQEGTLQTVHTHWQCYPAGNETFVIWRPNSVIRTSWKTSSPLTLTKTGYKCYANQCDQDNCDQETAVLSCETSLTRRWLITGQPVSRWLLLSTSLNHAFPKRWTINNNHMWPCISLFVPYWRKSYGFIRVHFLCWFSAVFSLEFGVSKSRHSNCVFVE